MADRSRIVVTGEPGLAGRQFALADPNSLLDRDGAGALYIGADPLCDVVLADPAAEAWHARLVGHGDHVDLEVIAGRVTIDGLEHLPGDRPRLGAAPFSIGQVVFSRAEQPRPDLPTTVLAPRTRLPEPLAAAARRLHVRVTDPHGKSEVLDLGDAARLRDGVVFGSHLSCDVLVCGPGVYPRHLRLVEGPHLLAEVLAGEVQLPDSGSPTPEVRGRGSFTAAAEPWRRWRRFRLGRCEVQLCRWPARDEPPRRRTTPTAPILEPPLPRSAPPPLPPASPRSLPPGLGPARCLAALIAGIRARPRRGWPLRAAAEATVADRDVAELLRAWSEHQVDLIRIGALHLTDTLRAPPTFHKGDLYGEVEVDHNTPRTDLVILGRFHSGSYLALPRHSGGPAGGSITVDVARGTEVRGRSLADVLHAELADAWRLGASTDLDPFLPTA